MVDKYIEMIQNLLFIILFLKILFRAYKFFKLVHTFSILIEILENSTIFQHFDIPSIALKR